ncbi:MAG: hypothetical protein GX628_05240 [Clostridiales bacterium]|nr:hypothetical protein [Clostridiales bacterium]
MKKVITAIVILLLLGGIIFYRVYEEKMYEIMTDNVVDLTFFFTGDVKLKPGETCTGRYVRATLRDENKFEPSDVEFVSKYDSIATIELDYIEPGGYLYYVITAIDVGETYVYAYAPETDATTKKIRVIVEEDDDFYYKVRSMPIYYYDDSKEQTLQLTNITSPCKNGSNATVNVCGKPDTKYNILVMYQSGPCTAEGLEPKISDDKGNVSWTWKIDNDIKQGEHKIFITGDSEEMIWFFIYIY